MPAKRLAIQNMKYRQAVAERIFWLTSPVKVLPLGFKIALLNNRRDALSGTPCVNHIGTVQKKNETWISLE